MKEKLLTEGRLVKSTQGRDKGKYYIVSAVGANRAYLVDGVTRKRQNPKAKNIKHLYILPQKFDLPGDNSFDNFAALQIKNSIQKVKPEE